MAKVLMHKAAHAKKGFNALRDALPVGMAMHFEQSGVVAAFGTLEINDGENVTTFDIRLIPTTVKKAK